MIIIISNIRNQWGTNSRCWTLMKFCVIRVEEARNIGKWGLIWSELNPFTGMLDVAVQYRKFKSTYHIIVAEKMKEQTEEKVFLFWVSPYDWFRAYRLSFHPFDFFHAKDLFTQSRHAQELLTGFESETESEGTSWRKKRIVKRERIDWGTNDVQFS